MLLNGLWKFSFNDGPETELPVPGCFDTTQEYRFLRGRGSYWTCVHCGGQVELRCGGIGLRADFFWDGCKIGSEVTAYTPLVLRFDAGERQMHELKIVCDNTLEETPESEFRYFYDFYGFGGIYREITLRELPESYVDYVRILPLDPESGRIAVHVENAGVPCPVQGSFDGGKTFDLPGAGDYELTVPKPQLWSLAHPHLHKLTLRCGEDIREIRFGLRTVEARNGNLYLNGQELKLIGVNRHDVCPKSGAAVSSECLRRDLEMIKAAGMNCVRGAHYPQSETMLKLADELGLLVWEEILGWENPLESLMNQEFRQRQKSALQRMIRAGVNHPSIILWGFLNEAATKDPEARDCMRELVALVRNEDPSRPTTFATMYGVDDRCLDLVDVISFNSYPAWYGGNNRFFDPEIVRMELTRLIDYVQNHAELAEKPVLISEIGAEALIGDHSGRRWSEDYQTALLLCALETVRNHPRCSGLLFWQFCNTPVDDNSRIMMRPRGYNNKGLTDEFRRPKQAWKHLQKILMGGDRTSVSPQRRASGTM